MRDTIEKATWSDTAKTGTSSEARTWRKNSEMRSAQRRKNVRSDRSLSGRKVQMSLTAMKRNLTKTSTYESGRRSSETLKKQLRSLSLCQRQPQCRLVLPVVHHLAHLRVRGHRGGTNLLAPSLHLLLMLFHREQYQKREKLHRLFGSEAFCSEW